MKMEYSWQQNKKTLIELSSGKKDKKKRCKNKESEYLFWASSLP